MERARSSERRRSTATRYQTREGRLAGLALAVASACSGATGPVESPRRGDAPAEAAPAEVALVESWPVEVPRGRDALPQTAAVWIEMIDGARASIDAAHFYAARGDALEPVIAALERAAGRGVAIRLLLDRLFHEQYPELAQRLALQPGVEVRLLDGASAYGGVLHCKYFVIDRRELFVGSANLDWRALTHIHELGLRVRAPALAAWLSSLFTLDWALAGGAPLDEARARARAAAVGARRRATVRFADEETALELAASPTGWLPDEPEGSSWALPRLVALLDRARARVRVQLLSYEPRFRDARPFLTLDAALRRAADRGVAVELLLSHWSVGPEKIAALRALDEHPGIELRIAAIPPWSGGEIPFARVVHAKYAIVDDDVAWLGTSNWSGDYFHHSRNVELFIDGRALAGALAAVFDALWTAPVTTSLAAWPFEQVEPDE